MRRDYSDDPARLGWLLFAVAQGGYIGSDGVNIKGGSSMPSLKLAKSLKERERRQLAVW